MQVVWAPIRLTKHDLQNALHLLHMREAESKTQRRVKMQGQIKQMELCHAEQQFQQDAAKLEAPQPPPLRSTCGRC